MKTGGPAFPWTLNEDLRDEGMTLREWYAGMAMQGFIAAHAGEGVPLPTNEETARWSFAYADAMLAEATKEPAKQ